MGCRCCMSDRDCDPSDLLPSNESIVSENHLGQTKHCERCGGDRLHRRWQFKAGSVWLCIACIVLEPEIGVERIGKEKEESEGEQG